MRKIVALCWLVALIPMGAAQAQVDPERMRIESAGGVMLTGNIAEVDFIADFSAFGGRVVDRTDGALDVDPSISYGFRASYRLKPRFSVVGGWLHSRGRFRIQFPALASEPGTFDLEGLLLGADDFGTGAIPGFQAERALADAATDVYQIAGHFEFPVLNRWAFPYVTLGAGIFKQRSDDFVISFEYEGDLPSNAEFLDTVGLSVAETLGLSRFKINETDPMISFGAGVRVSFGKRWSSNISVEDFVRIGTDHTEIDDSSTPPPDPTRFVLYSTTFRGSEGLVHNWGIQVALNYAIWPYGAPR